MARFFKPSTTDPQLGSIITNIVSSISYNNSVQDEEIGDSIKGYSLMEFIDDTYDLLNEYQKETQEFKDFTFRPEYVYNIIPESETNSLRYEIAEREYSLSSSSTVRRDYKWKLRDIVEDRKHPGYKVLVFDKLFDNTIIFTSWSKNYRDANKFAFKFEEIMDTYKALFKMKGLIDLRYEKRLSDKFREVSNYAWYGCPMKYYVRTQQVKLVYEKTLENISVELLLKKYN